MEVERHQRISAAFAAVYRRPHAERLAALDDVCGGDADVRSEVEALLREHDTMTMLLQTGRAARMAFATGSSADPALSLLERPPSAPEPTPGSIGEFEILDVLGMGGMGVVYRARQTHPQRLVALKVIKGGFASSDTLRRFAQESELLARLAHPGIAHIYGAGAATDGVSQRPYLVMELINGQRITAYARAAALDIRQRLALLADVCNAVQHAHQRGIIHRDLKPSNILVVADAGAPPRPKILDFGVARTIDPDVGGTLQTSSGQLVGTLAYMSPEQMLGDPHEVDTRTDVYALGVIGYELLGGRPPHDVSSKSIPAAIQLIRDGEAVRLGQLDRRLRGDVETIISKAMEKDKNRRYASAAGLAADIRRYLNHEPIAARPANTLYQLRKLAQRRRGVFIGGCIALLALLGGAGLMMYGLVESRDSEQRALKSAAHAVLQQRIAEDNERAAREAAERETREARRARTALEFLAGILWTADPFEPLPERTDFTVHELLDAASARLQSEFLDEPEIRAELLRTIGMAYAGLGDFEPARQCLSEDVRIHREVTLDDYRLAWALVELAGARPHTHAFSEEGIPLCEEAIDTFARICGPDTPEIVDAAHLRAILTWEARGADESWSYLLDAAIPLLRMLNAEQFESPVREAVEHVQSLLASGDIEAVRSYLTQYRGASLDTLGRLFREEGFEAARAYMRVHYAPLRDFPYFAGELPELMTSLGVWLESYGAPMDVLEPIFREGLELAREARNEEGSEFGYAYALRELAWILRLKGNLSEARQFAEEAVALESKLFQAGHPELATALYALGVITLDEGDATGAEPLLRNSLAARRANMADDDVAVAEIESALGACLTTLGRYEEAEPLLLRNLSVIRNEKRYRGERAHEFSERIARYYDAVGQPDMATRYRAR